MRVCSIGAFSPASSLARTNKFDCSKRGLKEQDLCGLHIPDAVETVDLSNNRLGGLFGLQFDGLRNMTTLSIANNSIVGLPMALSILHSLTSLDAQGNNITADGAAHLWTLTTLRSLNLYGNKLCVLSDEVGSMKELEFLNVGWNQLKTIPDSIGDLPALTTLDICRNELQKVPDCSLRIQSLTKLDVYGNLVQEIPEAISEMLNLSCLVAGWNHISVIPKSLIGMKQLTEFDLWGGSSLTSLPKYIGEMVSLTCLDLHANELNALPDSIGDLVNLKKFKLSINQLTSLPNSIGSLVSLEYLELKGNRLETLPRSIGSLTNLAYLSVEKNNLMQLVPEVGRLKALTTLKLGNNQLRALPLETGDLCALTLLDVTHNRLASLPPELSKINTSTLDKVLVGANPIQMPPIEVCAEGTKAILSYLSRVLSQCQSTDHGLMRGAASVFNVSIPSYSSAHGPAGEYTVFEVMVSTSGGGWCVHRRFSEFDTLRSAIIARLPSAQIPVLPPKAGLLQDNLDAEFLDDRRERLEQFMIQLLTLTDSISLDELVQFLDLGTVWRGCQYGDVDHVSFLATHGLDVNEQDEQERTPLHHAAIIGNVDMIKVLLWHGARSDMADAKGMCALDYAKESDPSSCVSKLLESESEYDGGQAPRYSTYKSIPVDSSYSSNDGFRISDFEFRESLANIV